MKKLLALVLALVMTLGLATVGTNAAYADADDIEYKEAVDVMTAIGVLAGDETGFRPADTLKRSEGAKIVAYLLLGNTTAEAIQATGNKFTDVPANHWAAGYIEYLTSAGVVGGVGGGKFDPDGDLTATQFAKMLLTALGYDAEIEGFGGSDWSINVQKVANQVDLFDGNDDVVGSAAVTREEAALYAYNTLLSPVVEYATKGTAISVGNDATVTIGASSAKPKTNDVLSAQTISRRVINDGTLSTYVVEFAEENYPKLRLSETSDDFARPADVWSYDGKKVGTYTAKEDQLYTVKTTSGTVYADLGLTSTYTLTDYYVDGIKQTPIMLEKNNTDDLNKVGGQGSETYVYYEMQANGTPWVGVYVVNTYVGKIGAVYPATAGREAYVSVTDLGTTSEDFKPLGLTGFAGTNTYYETTDFAVDDVVLFTYSNSDESIQSLDKAETVTGTLTQYTQTKQAVVGGTTYKYNAHYRNGADATLMNKAVDAVVTLDKYGNAINVKDNGVVNYAVVLNVNNAGGNYNASRLAKLLFTDGTTADVTVSNGSGSDRTTTKALLNDGTTAATADAIQAGDIVSFVINNDKSYTLTLQADGQNSDDLAITNGSAALTAGADTIRVGKLGTATVAAVANGNTKFLVATKNGTKTVYTAYEGIKNVPTVKILAGQTADFAVFAKTSPVATVVYIDATNTTKTQISSKDVIFVISTGLPKQTVDTGAGTYYIYDAIVNGEPTKEFYCTDGTIQYPTLYNGVSWSTFTDGAKVATLGNGRSVDLTLTTTGTKTNTGTSLWYGVGVKAIANGAVELGGTAYVPSADCKVFYITAAGDLTPLSGPSAIAEQANDKVWFNYVDGEVNFIAIAAPTYKGVTYSGSGSGSSKNTGYAINLVGSVATVTNTTSTTLTAQAAANMLAEYLQGQGWTINSVSNNGVTYTINASKAGDAFPTAFTLNTTTNLIQTANGDTPAIITVNGTEVGIDSATEGITDVLTKLNITGTQYVKVVRSSNSSSVFKISTTNQAGYALADGDVVTTGYRQIKVNNNTDLSAQATVLNIAALEQGTNAATSSDPRYALGTKAFDKADGATGTGLRPYNAKKYVPYTATYAEIDANDNSANDGIVNIATAGSNMVKVTLKNVALDASGNLADPTPVVVSAAYNTTSDIDATAMKAAVASSNANQTGAGMKVGDAAVTAVATLANLTADTTVELGYVQIGDVAAAGSAVTNSDSKLTITSISVVDNQFVKVGSEVTIVVTASNYVTQGASADDVLTISGGGISGDNQAADFGCTPNVTKGNASTGWSSPAYTIKDGDTINGTLTFTCRVGVKTTQATPILTLTGYDS